MNTVVDEIEAGLGGTIMCEIKGDDPVATVDPGTGTTVDGPVATVDPGVGTTVEPPTAPVPTMMESEMTPAPVSAPVMESSTPPTVAMEPTSSACAPKAIGVVLLGAALVFGM